MISGAYGLIALAHRIDPDVRRREEAAIRDDNRPITPEEGARLNG